jgi:hypothetical protein
MCFCLTYVFVFKSCCSLHGVLFSVHVLVLVNWVHGQPLLFPYSFSVSHVVLFTCSGLCLVMRTCPHFALFYACLPSLSVLYECSAYSSDLYASSIGYCVSDARPRCFFVCIPSPLCYTCVFSAKYCGVPPGRPLLVNRSSSLRWQWQWAVA